MKITVIGALLVALTVVIQAAGTTIWLRVYLARSGIAKAAQISQAMTFKVLVSTGLFLVVMHMVQILAWAMTYILVLPAGELQSLRLRLAHWAVCGGTAASEPDLRWPRGGGDVRQQGQPAWHLSR